MSLNQWGCRSIYTGGGYCRATFLHSKEVVVRHPLSFGDCRATKLLKWLFCHQGWPRELLVGWLVSLLCYKWDCRATFPFNTVCRTTKPSWSSLLCVWVSCGLKVWVLDPVYGSWPVWMALGQVYVFRAFRVLTRVVNWGAFIIKCNSKQSCPTTLVILFLFYIRLACNLIFDAMLFLCNISN